MLVAYAEGGAPTCPACAYPGADVRWQRAPHASGLGQSAGWGAPVAPALVQPRTSGKAVASMVLGIVGIVIYPFSFILGIIALVLGALARRDIRAGDGAVGGNGMAVAGIVLGIICMVFGFIVLAAVVFVLVADLGEGAAAAVGALGR